MEEHYPPNSDKSKSPPEDKKVERVTEGDAIRRKKPLSRRFSDTFIGGDAKTAFSYVVFGVLIPAAKDALADAASQGVERLIFGESRTQKRSSMANGLGRVNYAGISRSAAPTTQRTMSRRARTLHDFDEVVLQSRTEAEEVIDRLFELTSRHGYATVADLYELVGLKSTHVDVKHGWTDLRGAGVARVRNGYLLDLPETEPLD